MFAFVQGGKRTNLFANKHPRAHMQLMLPSWPELLRGRLLCLDHLGLQLHPVQQAVRRDVQSLVLLYEEGCPFTSACRVLVLDTGSEASPIGTT